MKIKLLLLNLVWLTIIATGQVKQGFFLNDWAPIYTQPPEYNDVTQTTDAVSVSIKVNFTDTITKVSPYVYGHNANPYTGFMTDNPTLVANLKNLNMGVMRGPGGSLSDIYFWDRNSTQRPTDIPDYLAGQTTAFTPWYGKRTLSETWRSDIDTLYSLLKLTNSTGILTVNYGYARYGTSTNPVSQAAHYAANWVRYDNGRSKFWEIGNENFGNWEAGYRIDQSLNKDGQPQYITGDLYGKHCLVFIDSMKNAAQQIGKDIKIGVVATEASGTSANWNSQLFAQVGGKADFYSVHSYYTPYNENSTVSTILNSPPYTASYMTYVQNGLASAGKPAAPVALTEYNIFAVGSKQQVSYIDGMHATLVLGQVIKQKYGLACRWDLANGWDNGNDHGLFSYGGEPNVPVYNPRPAFFYMYYFRKFFGDCMLNDTVKGSSNIIVYASSFTSGQAGVVIINKGSTAKVARLNIENFKFGDRYYTYTLTGGTDNGSFSGKVYVNGTGPTYSAGGPNNYETIKANSSVIADEIKISVPALSVVYALVDSGSKELTINEQYTPDKISSAYLSDQIKLFPNPVMDNFTLSEIPAGYNSIEIQNSLGEEVYSSSLSNINVGEFQMNINLPSGIYTLLLKGKPITLAKKFIVQK